LTTPAIKTDTVPPWKQELNQRLAAHKNRKGEAPPATAPRPEARQASTRAAQAAARVAARYAQAPSYSQMLAEEARAAVRAAEAASMAALEAQAAAESVLAGIEAASGEGPAWQPEFSRVPEPPQPPAPVFFDPFFTQDRIQDRIQARTQDRIQERQTPTASRPSPEDRPETRPASAPADEWDHPLPIDRSPEPVETARPIHANLIQFPRELIATRRARPRIAEGGVDTGRAGQLSIFEVDPGAISTQPEAAQPTEPAVADWARIRLDAEPDFGAERQPNHAVALSIEHLPVAPVGLRLMAALVDGALIGAAFLAAALMTALGIHHFTAGKPIELAAVAALLVIGVLYQALFFTWSDATPGMRYAGISLCTLDDQKPTREQLRRRVGALTLSVLPVGLGVLWALFDDDHLSWHDRLSSTYQRKG
jgi:uncharacterized RDD family membrane protein YckC